MMDFVSPKTGNRLYVKEGFLVSDDGDKYPIINNIPRFVEMDNYAAAFGLQWKSYAKTQLDSFSGTTISQERLERCLGFSMEQLAGKTVLEVGCGAGRFTELLVKGGALVHSVDLSVAVDVNKENIGNKQNYKIAQASVYELPYPNECFDIVLCLGVVQHTPSSEKTVNALWQKVKPGGRLVIDHYKWSIGYYSNLNPVYRAWLRRMKPEHSKIIVDSIVNIFFPMHWKIRNNKRLDWLLRRVSPVKTYFHKFPQLDQKAHYEWSKLDTFDGLTDYYKHKKTPAQIRRIIESLDRVESIWINVGGNGVEARCDKLV